VGGDYCEPALRSIAWEGRYLVIGFPAGIPKLPLNLTLLKSCDVRGVFWGAFAARDPQANAAHLQTLFRLWEEGKIAPRVTRIGRWRKAARRSRTWPRARRSASSSSRWTDATRCAAHRRRLSRRQETPGACKQDDHVRRARERIRNQVRARPGNAVPHPRAARPAARPVGGRADGPHLGRGDGYARDLIRSDFETITDDDIVRKLLGDLTSAGVEIDEAAIRAQIDAKTVDARRQLMDLEP
jgi:hypothetical protein